MVESVLGFCRCIVLALKGLHWDSPMLLVVLVPLLFLVVVVVPWGILAWALLSGDLSIGTEGSALEKDIMAKPASSFSHGAIAIISSRISKSAVCKGGVHTVAASMLISGIHPSGHDSGI